MTGSRRHKETKTMKTEKHRARRVTGNMTYRANNLDAKGRNDYRRTDIKTSSIGFDIRIPTPSAWEQMARAIALRDDLKREYTLRFGKNGVLTEALFWGQVFVRRSFDESARTLASLLKNLFDCGPVVGTKDIEPAFTATSICSVTATIAKPKAKSRQDPDDADAADDEPFAIGGWEDADDELCVPPQIDDDELKAVALAIEEADKAAAKNGEEAAQ